MSLAELFWSPDVQIAVAGLKKFVGDCAFAIRGRDVVYFVYNYSESITLFVAFDPKSKSGLHRKVRILILHRLIVRNQKKTE